MKQQKDGVVVGLFGTCGNSQWRSKVIRELELNGVKYFNPQVDDWIPEFAKIEAYHLINDDIVIFPVTGETYGTGSLSEVGFSINTALKSINEDTFRFLIVMIDAEVSPELMDNNQAAKESIRSRALVSAHLEKINHPNVYVVKDLYEMIYVTILLADIVASMKKLNRVYKHST